MLIMAVLLVVISIVLCVALAPLVFFCVELYRCNLEINLTIRHVGSVFESLLTLHRYWKIARTQVVLEFCTYKYRKKRVCFSRVVYLDLH